MIAVAPAVAAPPPPPQQPQAEPQPERPRAPGLRVQDAADDLPDDAGTVWRAVIAELKVQKREMLGSALAHGRVLSLSGDRVRLGYPEAHGMFRRQVERSQKDAEAALSKVLGRPMGLSLERVNAQENPTAPSSIAEEDGERTRARDERIRRASREHPSVLAAMKLFGGVVEHIRVVEEEQDEFAAAPLEEDAETGSDDA